MRTVEWREIIYVGWNGLQSFYGLRMANILSTESNLLQTYLDLSESGGGCAKMLWNPRVLFLLLARLLKAYILSQRINSELARNWWRSRHGLIEQTNSIARRRKKYKNKNKTNFHLILLCSGPINSSITKQSRPRKKRQYSEILMIRRVLN